MSVLVKLARFEFSRDDLHGAGSRPRAVRALIGVLLMLILLVSGYTVHLRDRQGQLENARGEERDRKQQFANRVAQLGNVQLYLDQVQDMQHSFDELLRQLPSDTEVPGLLEDISRAGSVGGLQFEEIRLLPEEAQPFYLELPIQITVVGDYHGLATFVSAVSALPRIVTLHDFSLAPVSRADGAMLRLNILARTYRYHEGHQL